MNEGTYHIDKVLERDGLHLGGLGFQGPIVQYVTLVRGHVSQKLWRFECGDKVVHGNFAKSFGIELHGFVFEKGERGTTKHIET